MVPTIEASHEGGKCFTTVAFDGILDLSVDVFCFKLINFSDIRTYTLTISNGHSIIDTFLFDLLCSGAKSKSPAALFFSPNLCQLALPLTQCLWFYLHFFSSLDVPTRKSLFFCHFTKNSLYFSVSCTSTAYENVFLKLSKTIYIYIHRLIL